MGLSYNVYLSSSRIYMCKSCKAHLSNHEDIISRVSSAPPPRRNCLFLRLPASTLSAPPSVLHARVWDPTCVTENS